MSGANVGNRQIRKGSFEAIKEYMNQLGSIIPENVKRMSKLFHDKEIQHW